MAQDPLVTIVGALYTGWALAGDLAQGNIRFSTGWYDRTLEAPQITVTNPSDEDRPAELGMGTVYDINLIEVNVWVKQLRTTGKGVGTAKDWKWKMREEVKRILKANKTGLTNIKWLIPNRTGADLDETDSVPPLLRWRIWVEAWMEY